jgi:hypothetical protein
MPTYRCCVSLFPVSMIDIDVLCRESRWERPAKAMIDMTSSWGKGDNKARGTLLHL